MSDFLPASDWADGTLDDLTALAVPGAKAPGRGTGWGVTTEHPIAVEVGARVLAAGGSVADALVAVTAAMYVVIPGTATLAGTFSAVIYERATGRARALNAGYSAVAAEATATDPYDHWRDRQTGRAVLVPGTMRGLESAWREYGKLPWGDLWQPAIRLADKGFPVYPRYHTLANALAPTLLRHESGRALFGAGDGVPAPPGYFAQPVLVPTLAAIAEEGADHCYTGAWAKEAIRAIQDLGGLMTMEDLAAYEARWDDALVGRYLDTDIYTNVPPQSGGAALVGALNIAQALGVHEQAPRWESPEALADLMDVYRATMEHVFFPGDVFTDVRDEDPDELARLQRYLSADYAAEVAEKIRRRELGSLTSAAGGHSHNIVAADSDGNLLTCTWTVYGQTWGDTGLFPGGIALNSSGFATALRAPKQPSGRVVEPLSVYVACRDGEPVLAATAIGVGLQAAHMQLAVDVLGRGDTVEDAVAAPRFGSFLRDYTTMLSHGKSLIIEPAFGPDVLESLKERQEYYVHEGPESTVFGSDTGSLAAIARDPATGELTVATDPRHVGTTAAG